MTVSAGQNSARPAVAPALLDRSIQALKLGLFGVQELVQSLGLPFPCLGPFPGLCGPFSALVAAWAAFSACWTAAR